MSSEPVSIGGLDVWQHRWTRVDGPPAEVQDPHYGRVFRFDVYRIGDGHQTAIFAAGEFSNGVFGFYLPAGSRLPVTPPALPIRERAARLAPYAPLIAAAIELPWIVLCVMMAMGTRENAGGPNPYWQRQFSFFLILPAVAGLIAGAVALFRREAHGTRQRVALAIGVIACAAFAYGLGRGMFEPIHVAAPIVP